MLGGVTELTNKTENTQHHAILTVYILPVGGCEFSGNERINRFTF